HGGANRHDRMLYRERPLRPRGALRRARELAAHQRSHPHRAARRDPGRHAGDAATACGGHPVAGGHFMSTPAMTQAMQRAEPAPREVPVSPGNEHIVEAMNRRYDAGFVTEIETDSLPPG